ncbi:MAG TPA: glycosyltransferase [Pyrinomonadaceae bacterium]|nr:glycosyltransferase [Pyrinomonadaceae bacterium]
MNARPTTLKGRNALFISYNGMLDPLGQSQVIPYLSVLTESAGLRFTLLSFERAAAYTPEGQARVREVERDLEERGIEWHRLRYHQRPSLPATFYDVAAAVRYAGRLIKRNRIEVVHGRGPIMATIGLPLKRRFGVKLIFDVRGLLADEYVDAGHWRAGSVNYRLTKAMERRCLAASDGVVTLTERIWPIIKEWEGLRGRSVAHEVIPCCVDLERFSFDAAAREARRAELGLQGRFVVVYSGSVGGWYLTEEMADFFAALSRVRADAHFLWLTPSAHDVVRNILRERGIREGQYTLLAARPADVASYLSAADAGLAFIKPCFSKLASSPTKNAEYLACGLPLIINAGIGDSDALVREEGVGALVNEFTAQEYERAAGDVARLLEDAESLRRRTREVAQRLFDVQGVGLERYTRLYEEVCLRDGAHLPSTNGGEV